MAEQIIVKCIKCGGEIITEDKNRLVKCRFCGKTFMMPSFIQEKVELSEVEKERDAERAARCEAEERLFTTVGTLNEISDSQREAKARLDALNLEVQKSKQEELGRLYEQADGLQRDREFDKAADAYRQMLVMGCEDVEIYWRLVMCHYGVEYQDDGGGRRIPSILKPDLTDPRELSVWRDMNARAKPGEGSYLEDMAQIEAILDRYRAVRGRMDFDVFISVKQTIDGHPTNDSEVGLKLYDCLTRQGLRVFNSKKSELLPVGENYEPYIMAALLSARVMIVVGTCAEHMNAQWVRNEWSRFQWLQKSEKDGGRRKLFCYLAGGMKPRDIPRALNPDRQAIVDGIGAEKLLLKALDYLMPKTPGIQEQSEAPLAGTTFEAEEQKLVGWLSVERYDLVARWYDEQVEQGLFLNQPLTHLYALCAERHVPCVDQLGNTEDDLSDMRLFKLARSAGDSEQALMGALLKRNKEYRFVVRAEGGDPQTEYEMAERYFQGEGGTRKDASEAAKWYRRAAEHGHSEAQFMLARMCENAMGVPMDMNEARKWYLKAAKQGHAGAQYKMGEAYDLTDKNRREAEKWYYKAAMQGNAKAQFNLGMLYELGPAPRPYTNEADMYISGIWESRVIPIERDFEEAVKWYQMSAEQAYVRAQRRLGEMYEEGTGVSQDYGEAMRWYRKAAEQGDAKAQNVIGLMYDGGTGVEKDPEEAVKWFRMAADNMDVDAQVNLGLCCVSGSRYRRDYSEAEKWLGIAAHRGDELGQYYYGMLYEKGYGVRRDFSMAAKWYAQSAEQGYDRAQYKLGLMYEKGHGVKRDREEAAKWYRLAAEQGDADALKKCARLGIKVSPRDDK